MLAFAFEFSELIANRTREEHAGHFPITTRPQRSLYIERHKRQIELERSSKGGHFPTTTRPTQRNLYIEIDRRQTELARSRVAASFTSIYVQRNRSKTSS